MEKASIPLVPIIMILARVMAKSLWVMVSSENTKEDRAKGMKHRDVLKAEIARDLSVFE